MKLRTNVNVHAHARSCRVNGSLGTTAKRVMVQDLVISGFSRTNPLKIITSLCCGSAKFHCESRKKLLSRPRNQIRVYNFLSQRCHCDEYFSDTNMLPSECKLCLKLALRCCKFEKGDCDVLLHSLLVLP